MAETAIVDTPATPPPEEFATAAEHAAHYNALESAIPVVAVTPPEPAAPTGSPVAPDSSSGVPTPSPAEPPVEAEFQSPSKEAEIDDSAAIPLFFRNSDGTFRKAKGSEIRSKLRETVDQLRARNRELQALAARVPAATSTGPAAELPSEVGARPSLNSYADVDEWQKADTAWLQQTIAAERRKVEQQAHAQTAAAAWQARVESFRADHPDYDDLVDAVSDIPVPPLLGSLLTQDVKGPAMAYYLASHPEQFSELVLMNANTPVTDMTLAALRRLLVARLDAATSTGTASPAVIHRPAAAPIAPVRTSSPVATDSPPGDENSAREHFDYWNRKEREARQRR